MSEPAATYWTPEEVASHLGCSVRTVRRRCEAGELPTLRLGPRLLRIEGHAVDATVPAPLPAGPRTVEPEWVAEVWRVSHATVLRLIKDGRLPARQAGRRYLIARRAILSLSVDATVGDDSTD